MSIWPPRPFIPYTYPGGMLRSWSGDSSLKTFLCLIIWWKFWNVLPIPKESRGGRQSYCCSDVRRCLGGPQSQSATVLSGRAQAPGSCAIWGKSHHLPRGQLPYFSNRDVHSCPPCLILCVVGVKRHSKQRKALYRQQALHMQRVITVLLWLPALNWNQSGEFYFPR